MNEPNPSIKQRSDDDDDEEDAMGGGGMGDFDLSQLESLSNFQNQAATSGGGGASLLRSGTGILSHTLPCVLSVLDHAAICTDTG